MKMLAHAPAVYLFVVPEKKSGIAIFPGKSIAFSHDFREKMTPKTTIANAIESHIQIRHQCDANVIRNLRIDKKQIHDDRTRELCLWNSCYCVALWSPERRRSTQKSEIIKRWHLKLYLYQLHGNKTRNETKRFSRCEKRQRSSTDRNDRTNGRIFSRQICLLQFFSSFFLCLRGIFYHHFSFWIRSTQRVISASLFLIQFDYVMRTHLIWSNLKHEPYGLSQAELEIVYDLVKKKTKLSFKNKTHQNNKRDDEHHRPPNTQLPFGWHKLFRWPNRARLESIVKCKRFI